VGIDQKEKDGIRHHDAQPQNPISSSKKIANEGKQRFVLARGSSIRARID
jgi:hypothetical protein